MEQLAQIMIGRPGSNKNLLKKRYRDPGITAYNRLEPRPRTEDFQRSLRAEVRDALWMLTRQWQMGEFEAEDAGTAIDARLLAKNIHIDRIALDGINGGKYDEMIPMETFVEREAIPFTYSLKIQMAQYFLKLHPPGLSDTYLDQYKIKYGMATNLEANFRGQTDGLNLYTATKKRGLDGERIYRDIKDNIFSSVITISTGDEVKFEKIMQDFQNWFSRQYAQPADATESAWHPGQLDYQFSIAATDKNNKQVVLAASQYYQGALDWYAFDNVPGPQPIGLKSGSEEEPRVEDTVALSFMPTPASFKGVPNPRFWEMEDRQIDFGKFNAKNTDLLLLSFSEFGLVYANDWFMVPYKIPVNTLCEIQGLVITDVFGDRTLVRAADEGADNNWQRWSMFNLSNRDNIGQYNRMFFLPASLTTTLESAPIEEVNFIRDEMANMVWGIEGIIPDATGKGINGNEAADKTGVKYPEITDSPAKIRYLLGTSVPENWIPFIPVQRPGSYQDIYFQRAAMPKLGTPPKDVIKAKGVLLTEVISPYFINEEEIPYSGTIVTRSYQRTRWYNGKTFLWIGRYRETGRGEGNSDLKFDQIPGVNET